MKYHYRVRRGTPLIKPGQGGHVIGARARVNGHTVQDVIPGDYNGTLAENATDPANFPRIEDNRYLFIQLGNRNYALTTGNVLYTPRYASDLTGSWTAIPGADISPTGSGPMLLILEVTWN